MGNTGKHGTTRHEHGLYGIGTRRRAIGHGRRKAKAGLLLIGAFHSIGMNAINHGLQYWTCGLQGPILCHSSETLVVVGDSIFCIMSVGLA